MTGGTVLVTGATGFVGRQVVHDLIGQGYTVRAALRSPRPGGAAASAETVQVGAIDEATDWSDAVAGIDAVVHLAAHVHDMDGDPARAARLYHSVNVLGTESLAVAAARAGVRRFVYVSSIKAMGEHHDRPWHSSDTPCPTDAYGQSKLEAERRLAAVSIGSGMDHIVIRPPLVYGPGVKANFLAMLRWVERGWPLPLGAIRSRRSLISVWNLADLLITSVRHPVAGGRVFLASDGADLSLVELLGALAGEMGRPLRLVPVPEAVLVTVARVCGFGSRIDRLVQSLQVDIDETRRLLEWDPPLSPRQGLAKTVAWYRAQGNVT